jgi:SNF2 family DNA or RNA helicase
VLADDPGAGKTIMAGLLLKELKLRGVVDRCLIPAQVPLTSQWQDEMLDKFDEQFEIVSSEQVRHQLGRSPWERYPMVITSIDFAKRDDVRDDLLRTEWDFVIVDEADKCAASRGSDDSAVKTRRYALAESLAGRTERLLLMTTERLVAVAARLLPGGGIWDGAGPAGATRQADDQGCCGGGGEGI